MLHIKEPKMPPTRDSEEPHNTQNALEVKTDGVESSSGNGPNSTHVAPVLKVPDAAASRSYEADDIGLAPPP